MSATVATDDTSASSRSASAVIEAQTLPEKKTSFTAAAVALLFSKSSIAKQDNVRRYFTHHQGISRFDQRRGLTPERTRTAGERWSFTRIEREAMEVRWQEHGAETKAGRDCF